MAGLEDIFQKNTFTITTKKTFIKNVSSCGKRDDRVFKDKVMLEMVFYSAVTAAAGLAMKDHEKQLWINFKIHMRVRIPAGPGKIFRFQKFTEPTV